MVKGKATGTKVTLATAKKAVTMTPEGLRRLALNHMGIAAFPPCLLKIADVDELDLGRNLMVKLPAGTFGKLASLTCLDLHSNKLEALPDCMGELVALTHLNLSNNRLTAAGLPPTLGLLTGLTSLNLGLNLLEELPDSMAGLTGLKELGLFDNLLIHLPEWLKLLPNLTKVNAQRNPFPAQANAGSEEVVLVALSNLCEDCAVGRRKESVGECGDMGPSVDNDYAGLLTPNSVAMGTQDVWRRKQVGATLSGLESNMLAIQMLEMQMENQTLKKQVLDNQTPDAQTPDAQTPDNQTPDAQTPDNQTPDAQTPDAQTPDDQAP